MRLGIVGLVIFIAAYIASILLYVHGGMGLPQQVAESRSGPDDTMVTVYIEDMGSNNEVLHADVVVTPGLALIDPATHKLKDDLTVGVTSALTPAKHIWTKGALPEITPVSFRLAGEVAEWPFDKYRTGPITVDLSSGAAHQPVTAGTTTFVDRLLGWDVAVTRADAGAAAPYHLNMSRTKSTAALGVVILGVLVALAGVSVFVAVQTVYNRRKFQPPMTTWYAAMLFAVMPLRNALPDAPPFGSWIDITVVLWVIVALVVSMVVYIYCWWRHLRPDDPADTD